MQSFSLARSTYWCMAVNELKCCFFLVELNFCLWTQLSLFILNSGLTYIHVLHVTHISKHFEMCFLKKDKLSVEFPNPLYKLCQLCVYMIIPPCVSDATQGAQWESLAKVSWWWSEWCQLVWLTVDKTATYWQCKLIQKKRQL